MGDGLLRLLLVQLRLELVLGLLELLSGDELVCLGLETMGVNGILLFGGQLLELLCIHLHSLWQLRLAKVQLSLLADALLSFLFLLLDHLVED